MTAVPGWYADPSVTGMVRYWDGGAWTEHVQPVPASAQAQAQAAAPVPVHPSPQYEPVPTHQPGYNAYAPAVPVKNNRATRALVWGIIGLLINPFAVPSILAIVYGAQGRKVAEQVESTGQLDSGRGRATAGLVVGIIGAALFVFWILLSMTRN